MTVSRETSFSPNYDAQPRQDGDFLSLDRNPVVTKPDEFDPYILYDKGGLTISEGMVELEDGTFVEIAYSEIDKNRLHVPEGVNGLATYEATAWTTRGRGMYTYELINQSDMGVEGTIMNSSSTKGKRYSPTENGRNLLEIMRWQAPLLERDEKQVMLKGVSQGFHVGVSAADQAKNYNMDVIAMNMRAGCLPDGLTRSILRKAPRKIANEILALPRLRGTGRALFHFAKTLDATKRGTYTHGQTVRGLLSGHAGWHMRHMPQSTFGHFSAGEGDFMSDSEAIEEIVEKFPHASVSTDGRSHLDDAAGHYKFQASLDRDVTIAAVLIENPHLRTLPLEIVHKELYRLACEQNPLFIH